MRKHSSREGLGKKFGEQPVRKEKYYLKCFFDIKCFPGGLLGAEGFSARNQCFRGVFEF